MKEDSEHHNELLKKLALGGDAHAFFSLTVPYFQGRYLRERSGGTTMQDAQKKVLAEAVELLEAVRHVSFKHFDSWFEEHCSLLSGPEQADDADVLIDKKLITETENFLSRCSRELLRTGSDIKRSANLRRKKFPQALLRHRSVVWLLMALAAVIVGSGLTLLMVKYHLAIQVHFLAGGHSASVQFPPAAWSASDTPAADLPKRLKPQTDTLRQSDAPVPSPPEVSSSDSVLQNVQPAENPTAPATQNAGTQRRPLPPVVPKARVIIPPPPPPPVPVEPARQEAPAYEESTTPVQQPAYTPAAPPSSPEPETTY